MLLGDHLSTALSASSLFFLANHTIDLTTNSLPYVGFVNRSGATVHPISLVVVMFLWTEPLCEVVLEMYLVLSLSLHTVGTTVLGKSRLRHLKRIRCYLG